MKRILVGKFGKEHGGWMWVFNLRKIIRANRKVGLNNLERVFFFVVIEFFLVYLGDLKTKPFGKYAWKVFFSY